MAAPLRPLLLALVLLGSSWAGTEAFSLSDFLLFDVTTASSPITDAHPSGHDYHHHGQHTTKEYNSTSHNHAHQQNHVQPGEDHTQTHHDHPHTHNHNQRHDHTQPHSHDNPHKHPSSNKDFQDPLNLYKRRQSKQWPSTTNTKLSLNPTTARHEHKDHSNHHDHHYHHHTHPHDHYHYVYHHDHTRPHNYAHHGNHRYHDQKDHQEPPLYFPVLFDHPPPLPPLLPKLLLPPPPPPLPKCPMLYSRVGSRCVAIFSIARMTWNDARLFCDGIFGELFTFSHVMDFYHMVNFLKKEGLSSALWVGGRAGANGWYWTGQQSFMPLGTPFWAVRRNTKSSPAYIQKPATSITDYDEWCAAMNSEDYYYLSDAKCKEKKAPVCVLRQDADIVVAQGNTNYYPALDRSFKIWNRMDDCEGDDESSTDSNDERSDESNGNKKHEEEDEDDDENEDEEDEKVEVEEEVVVESTSIRTPEIAVTVPEEEEKEEDVKGYKHGENEAGSGISEVGDDEDMVEGSGNVFKWDPWGRGSGIGPEENGDDVKDEDEGEEDEKEELEKKEEEVEKDDEEEDVKGHEHGKSEAGSGMGEVGDDEDLVEGSGNLLPWGQWDRGSGFRKEDYNAIDGIFIE